MFVGVQTSCDPDKLNQVLIAGRGVLKSYYALSKEDRDEVLLIVAHRFELDNGKYPKSVYVQFCKNKANGMLTYKNAQKRRNSQVVDGKRVFMDDISLNMAIGKEEDAELEEILPDTRFSLSELELLVDIERIDPALVPLVKEVLAGKKLTKLEQRLLKEKIHKEDLL